MRSFVTGHEPAIAHGSPPVSGNGRGSGRSGRPVKGGHPSAAGRWRSRGNRALLVSPRAGRALHRFAARQQGLRFRRREDFPVRGQRPDLGAQRGVSRGGEHHLQLHSEEREHPLCHAREAVPEHRQSQDAPPDHGEEPRWQRLPPAHAEEPRSARLVFPLARRRPHLGHGRHGDARVGKLLQRARRTGAGEHLLLDRQRARR